MKRKYTRRNVSKNRNNKKRTYKNRNNKKRTYKNRNNKKRTYKKRSYRRKGYTRSKCYNKKQLGGDEYEEFNAECDNLRLMYKHTDNSEKAHFWRYNINMLKHYGAKWIKLRKSTYKELYSEVKKEYNVTEEPLYAHIDSKFPEERVDYDPIACKEIQKVVGTTSVYEFETTNRISYGIRSVDKDYMHSVWGDQLITGTEGFGVVELVTNGKYLIQERIDMPRARFVVKKIPWTGLPTIENSFLNENIALFDTLGAGLVFDGFNRYMEYVQKRIGYYFITLYNITKRWYQGKKIAQELLVNIGKMLDRRFHSDNILMDDFKFTFKQTNMEDDIHSLAGIIQGLSHINNLLVKIHNKGIDMDSLFSEENIGMVSELFSLYTGLNKPVMDKLGIFTVTNKGKLEHNLNIMKTNKMGGTKITKEININNCIVAEAYEYLPEGEVRAHDNGGNIITSGNTTGKLVGGAMTRQNFLDMYDFAITLDPSEIKSNDELKGTIESANLKSKSWTDLYKAATETDDPLSGVTKLFRDLITFNKKKYSIKTKAEIAEIYPDLEDPDPEDPDLEDPDPEDPDPEDTVPETYHTGEFLYELTVEHNAKIILLGDIHGSVQTLWRQINKFIELGYIIWALGASEPKIRLGYYIVFLGDICDRGPWSLESYLLIGLLIKNNPDQCILNRGNHETEAQFTRYGFTSELKTRVKTMITTQGANKKIRNEYENKVIHLFKSFFSTCPSAVLVKYPETQHVWCCHGGVPLWFKDEHMISCRLFPTEVAVSEQNIAGVLMKACQALGRIEQWERHFYQEPNGGDKSRYKDDLKRAATEYKKLTGVNLGTGLNALMAAAHSNSILSGFNINNQTSGYKYERLESYLLQVTPLDEMRWNDVALTEGAKSITKDYDTERISIKPDIICKKLNNLGCCFMVRGHQDSLANHVLHPTDKDALYLTTLLEPAQVQPATVVDNLAIVEIKIKKDSQIKSIISRGTDITRKVFPPQGVGGFLSEDNLPIITISTSTGYGKLLPRDSHLILHCEPA